MLRPAHLLIWLPCLAGLPAHGAPLADPTRPPATPGAADGGGPARPPGAATRPAASASAPAATAPELQSVHLPRQGTASALVDGRLLQVGDRLAWQGSERTVIAIDAQGLLLQAPGRGREPQRLWLLPSAIPAAHPAPTKPPQLAVARSTRP